MDENIFSAEKLSEESGLIFNKNAIKDLQKDIKKKNDNLLCDKNDEIQQSIQYKTKLRQIDLDLFFENQVIESSLDQINENAINKASDNFNFKIICNENKESFVIPEIDINKNKETLQSLTKNTKKVFDVMMMTLPPDIEESEDKKQEIKNKENRNNENEEERKEEMEKERINDESKQTEDRNKSKSPKTNNDNDAFEKLLQFIQQTSYFCIIFIHFPFLSSF